jgi:hypothetical protein
MRVRLSRLALSFWSFKMSLILLGYFLQGIGIIIQICDRLNSVKTINNYSVWYSFKRFIKPLPIINGWINSISPKQIDSINQDNINDKIKNMQIEIDQLKDFCNVINNNLTTDINKVKITLKQYVVYILGLLCSLIGIFLSYK